MNTCKCLATMLMGLLFLPTVARGADAAAEAFEKGKACLKKKDFDSAVAAFTEVIRLNPKDAKAYNNRGDAFGEKEEYDKAIADYTRAIQLNPKYAEAYFNRGFVHAEKEEYDKAIADYTEAIRLKPSDAEAYYHRGDAFVEDDEPGKAIADYTAAIRLNPKFAEAYDSRGNVYAEMGEPGKAILDLAEAVRLEPTDAAFQNSLAWFLATCPEKRFRDGPRAIDSATQACEQTKWIDPEYLDTLAAAYAEAGKFDKAMEFQQKAVELAPKDAEKDALQKRLALYRSGQPYREPAKKK